MKTILPVSKNQLVRIIKRYSNRKLYNPEISEYVTLDVLLKYLRSERPLLVIDTKTGQDITERTVLMAISTFECNKPKPNFNNVVEVLQNFKRFE